jgi:hypothetical protein
LTGRRVQGDQPLRHALRGKPAAGRAFVDLAHAVCGGAPSESAGPLATTPDEYTAQFRVREDPSDRLARLSRVCRVNQQAGVANDLW